MAHEPKPATLAAYQTLRATKIADTEATYGAVVGQNLFAPNGSLITMAQFGGGTGTGTTLDTTDDLQEGQYNLYFTNQRAQDAVGGILTDTATIDFTYNQTTHVITADLKDLANSGVGAALVKITRDSKGRVAGTSPATTDDLTEGSSNKYFTEERAQDAVGNALVDTPRIDLTYDDTANTISADLVVVPNGGGGTMWRFTVNAYGQVTGRTAATTDDLPEGVNNLYFTKSRVAGSLVAGGGITLSVDGSGNTSIATTAQAGGMDLTDWTNVALTDWTNIQLSDWTSQTVFSFNGRKGDVLPAMDDYQTNQIKPSEYTLLTLPSPATYKGRHVYCTNLVEGYAPVWSDGSNWRRFTDNSVAN